MPSVIAYGCDDATTQFHPLQIDIRAYRPGCVGFWAVFRCYKAERWGLDSL